MAELFQCNQIDVYVNKYSFAIDKYHLPPTISQQQKVTPTQEVDNLEPLKDCEVHIVPSFCVWQFMSENEVEEIQKVKKFSVLKKIIDRKLSKLILQGVPKTIFKELILSVIKYARKYYLDSQQTGAILSIFYNIHRYFTCNLWITAEEVYKIFKKYVFHHSITCPPGKIKIFDVKESKKIMVYFCTIYMRNLPIIRLLSLPNYGLVLRTRNQEDIVVEEEKPATKPTKEKKKGGKKR